MSCLEKRHISHRMGSMLHHRFPNGFTDLLMDETDREVSTLTDRAFRSLCVGDDAVYNDDFLYGYSPYSCLKPLAGEPLKKNHPKESKKAAQHKSDKSDAQSWKQQQQNISHMSSFLKVLSAAEESCEGMLIKNGDVTDSNGESWDKSALRSIERELSEFSSDYHTSLTDRHYKNYPPHQSGNGSSNKKSKDVTLSSGKSTKTKNGKSAVKLRKLNIKNFFLHSEFSPFQTWTDFNRYPFSQENTISNILSTDNLPKWYDLPFYKELTEAHRKETLHTEEAQTCQKQKVEPSDTEVLKPIPAAPPPKVLPKPSVPLADKRCSSDGGDGHAAPWRRSKYRAKSAVPVNQVGIPPQQSNSKAIDETLLFVKKEIKSVEVKAVEDDSSLASTPFSICQLMTPVIPSRQPTETSEVLQAVLSPSVLDLLGRPHSETKGTSEPPVKRESYKSLASSILFNLKDNRKRVKSRYSPPKFKTSELPDGETQYPQTDHVNQAASEGSGSGLSTPGIMKDLLTVCSPSLEPIASPNIDLTKHDTDKPLSDDYLLSNLLQTKREAVGNNHGQENPISPFIPPKKDKSPMAKKQNYPSLNLYKKASPVDIDFKYLQVPLSISTPAKNYPPTETKNIEIPPNVQPTNTGLSPKTLNVVKDFSPYTHENGGQSPDGKRLPNVPEKTQRMVKDAKEKDFNVQPAPEENDPSGQTSTMNVIRATRDAINAARNEACSASYPDSINRQISDTEEMKQKETEQKASTETSESTGESRVTENYALSQNHATGARQVGKSSNMNKEPPPVPKRNFAKSDIEQTLDKQQRCKADKTSNGDLTNDKLDLPLKQNEPVQKQDKLKHVFSARQNNYIKHQRYAVRDNEQPKEYEENPLKVSTRKDTEITPLEKMRDSEHIFNDLQALKQLERVRLGDRMLEYARSKLEIVNIDEEAKAKNDLISRELRNIKRGMLSMRGNTSAKKKIFAKKEKEQSKDKVFTKLDSNVIVNKALLNDNYDKAKMALEEVISERERRRKIFTEQDSIPTFEENDKGSETWVQEGNKECITELRGEEKDSTSKIKSLKERLNDFKDQNLRQILAQTQPRPSETHKLGGRVELPGRNMVSNEIKAKSSYMKGSLDDNSTQNSEIYFEGHSRSREESGKYFMNECVDKMLDAPPVPPRNKKGSNKRDGSTAEEKNTEGEIVNNKGEIFENPTEQYGQIRTSSKAEEAPSSQRETSSYEERQDNVNNANLKLNTATERKTCGSGLTSNNTMSENAACLSPKQKENETKADNFQIIMSLTESADSQKTNKKKLKAHSKSDHLIRADDNMTWSLKAETKPDKINDEEANVETEAFCEIPRNTVSPLLSVNGVSIAQSPPDQGSLSSKSSYFSAESALQRNTETESNVYHCLENLTLELEGDNGSEQTVLEKELDKSAVEYYSLSDHKKGLEDIKPQIKTPQKEPEDVDTTDGENVTTNEKVAHEENGSTMFPTNAFSPTLEIPALFKIKDNTFNNKTKKPIAPWSPRGSLNISERVEKNIHPELPLVNETITNNSSATSTEIFNPGEILSPLLLISPSNSQSENTKKPQEGMSLTVPQEEDRVSGVTPSSEGIESLTMSTADTADEATINAGVMIESEKTKAPSEQSGSICSGSDSQMGLPKPPAILPKTEKAVLKAIKLTNRRMKKEEAQKLCQKSSQSSSKHRTERPKSDKPEQKTSSSAKTGKKSEKKHKEKYGSQNHESHIHHDNTQSELLPSYNENHYPIQTEMSHKTRRQSHDSVDCISQSRDMLPDGTLERQGRSSDRHVQEKPEQRHFSTDRIISNVPVYKDHADERPASDRSFHRSQSIDRYIVGKAGRRLSADVPTNEKLEPRTQRIEKSIIQELQQRGRPRDKESRGNSLRRSHSIDAYHTEAPPLSRQSSHTSQLSRQSSIEHTIVTQSFPMTQRKLLQDPDSGQYFFVDLPVQVKTKTFFDPNIGSYVQLPVQPPGALPRGAHMEVLTPPMVVYHSFMPVPLSPMAHNTTIQAPQMELNDLEQRHLERTRQMHCKEGHPYLEPAYGQQDHMLGEFLGTEELDCPS
ncbi:uncharacterized protein LOC108250776 [Kryptolebias marmoratus]|uniref:DUF4585 domain-containing protein n=1 Tax=Kryptolebias marmoratus TaxID=37003 RepID=A0A3Q3GE99_KRYMA|nr:uncharacterized protein LOC108250776 [Kryptolebias marmoratus]